MAGAKGAMAQLKQYNSRIVQQNARDRNDSGEVQSSLPPFTITPNKRSEDYNIIIINNNFV